MKRDYDEAYELLRYIGSNYYGALSEREKRLHRAATLELKARYAGSPETAKRLRGMDGHFLDAEVASIAESGLRVFEEKCYLRLLDEHGHEIYINRCERCARIVASPVACACVWCGYHWYERRSEMIARAKSPIYPKHSSEP